MSEYMELLKNGLPSNETFMCWIGGPEPSDDILASKFDVPGSAPENLRQRFFAYLRRALDGRWDCWPPKNYAGWLESERALDRMFTIIREAEKSRRSPE